MTTTHDLMQDVLAEEHNMAKRLDQLVRAGLMAPQALPILHRGLSKLNAGMAITGQDRDAVTNLLNSLLFIVLGDDTMFQRSQTTVRQNKQEHGYNVATNVAMEAKKDPGEYDYEGDMAMSQLKSIMMNAKRLHDSLEPDTNLPEWVQSKITLAEDYVTTAANYIESTLNEIQGTYGNSRYNKNLKIVHKGEVVKDYGTDTKPNKASREKMAMKMKADRAARDKNMKEEAIEEKRGLWDNIHAKRKRIKSGSDERMRKPGSEGAPSAADLKASQTEEVETIDEGRPSQQHPLEGHEYHKKSDSELEYIAKDAHKAAEAMKGHNTGAENKYRDQASDSATVRHFRKTSGMPTWYKKKYEHIKESDMSEDEQIDELSKATLGSYVKKASDDVSSLSDYGGRHLEKAIHHTNKAKSNPPPARVKIDHAWHAQWAKHKKHVDAARDAHKVFDKHLEKSRARRQGIDRAIDKLIKKEETEEVNELNREAGGTLSRYIDKTRNDPKRKAGNDSALKKKWPYYHGEPKVKGVDRTKSPWRGEVRNEEVEPVDEATVPSPYEDDEGYHTHKQIHGNNAVSKEDWKNGIRKPKASDKEVKMATGIPHDKRYVGGNMTGAISAIEKIRKNLSKHPRVVASLKAANEATKLYKDLAYPTDGGVELSIENELQEGYAEKFQTALKASGKTLAQMSDDEKKAFFKHVDSIHTSNSGE